MKFSGMLKENSLKDKVILVTGGGTGLGKSMSKYFLELGANVIITSRKNIVLQDTAKEYSTEVDEEIAKPILRHRIVKNYKAEAEGLSVDSIIENIL